MDSASAYSAFYPTSSSTLSQHSCCRLLWLPLSSCLKMAGEHVRNLSTSSSLPPLSQQSALNSFSRGGGGSGSLGFGSHAASDADDDLVSGFELRFKHACIHSAAQPMNRFRECFVAVPSPGQGTAGSRSASAPAVATETPAHYRADAKLRFLIGDDAGASQWENMDIHRIIHGVIVVVNTSCLMNISLTQVLEVVRTVFSAQYRDKVCRCYVVTGPPAPPERSRLTPASSNGQTATPSPEMVTSILSSFPSRTFVPVDATLPVDAVAAEAMEDMARNVIFTLNATLGQWETAMNTVAASKANKSKVDLAQLRTPLDLQMGSGSGGGGGAIGALEGMKPNLLASRFAKKRADILIQLGATDLALKAYGDTQFASNADALWCSATLESIAAARYQQWAESLASQLPVICDAIASLQSDETDWTAREKWGKVFAQCESLAAEMGQRAQKALSYFKGPCVPNSMRQRLTKEVDEVLIAKTVQLATLLTRARGCVEAGTTYNQADPSVYFIGTELKQCVEDLVRAGLGEIEIYLKESLRQQRHATSPANKKTLQDRDLETRLKTLAFLVDRGAGERFIRELNEVRTLFSVLYGDVVQKVLRFFTYLCICSRYYRKAVGFLVETAYNDRRAKLHASTIQSLVRACMLSGIALNSIPELHSAVLVDPLCRLFTHVSRPSSADRGWLAASAFSPARTDLSQSMSAAGDTIASAAQSASGADTNFYTAVRGAEELHPEQGTSKQNELALTSLTLRRHIPLLTELLDALREADCRGSVRCQLATLLLFRYPTYLDRATAQLLTDIARSEALRLEPHVRPATAALPFLSSWEALSLPPNLAPKTVAVGGAVFTFIDTARLKLTVLSLNGRRLNSRVVWTVGDVGTVMVSLYNPYPWAIKLLGVVLQSRSCAALDENNRLPPGTEAHTTGPLAPTCYVLSHVLLPAQAKTRVLLQVQPKMEGYLRIEGVELRPEYLKGATLPVQGKLPEPIGIPVLQQLPLVSCTVSVSELEVFSGQCIDFTVRVVNCGQLPIAHISLTAHGEACLLEDCEGCKERASDSDVRVLLNKAALEAARRAPLRPGDVVTIPVHLQAPKSFDVMESHFVIFRVDCSLPHEKPTMPPNVPHAVPVFGVIPRRVTETRMRVFYAPTLAVTSVRLSRDKRFVDVRLVNRSERYTVELALSSLPFANYPDALLMAGADYVVPPIDISRVSDNGKQRGSFLYAVPWAVRELVNCTGTLTLDLGLVAAEVVCSEPLDELRVSVDVVVPQAETGDRYLTSRHWESDGLRLGHLSKRRQQGDGRRATREPVTEDTNEASVSSRSAPSSPTSPYTPVSAVKGFPEKTTKAKLQTDPSCRPRDEGRLPYDEEVPNGVGNSLPIVVPAVTPIQLFLSATANWRRAVPLRFLVSLSNNLDVGVLSGPVDCIATVGDNGKCVCEQQLELLAFKTGEHAVKISVRDSADREITHVMRFIVQHDRD